MYKDMRDKLVNNFLRISSIPRESGHEEKIANFFVDIAKKNNLYYFKDENNNVLIKKKGLKNGVSIALQAHLDMVCVKGNNSKHDFRNEGIEVIVDGDVVKANDTSLGADQGVGLALMLTLLEDNKDIYPNLEFLFTTEEETTFKGAETFPYDKVESKKMLNLDSGCDDIIFVGADGDIFNEFCFKGKIIENNLPSYKLILKGCASGNSGDNIELSKNNAITTMASFLKDKDIYIKSINGGLFENDIAESCEVILNTNEDLEKILNDADIKVEPIDNKESFTKEDSANIINEILSLKCGYVSNSSANLGCISIVRDEVKIKYIIRGSNKKDLEELNKKIIDLKYGFKAKEVYRDSIWESNKDSQMLCDYKNIYFKEYHEYPREEIGHGGIECAAIKNKIKDLDIISIGASMKNIHTKDEVTYISSWIKIYKLLVDFLEYIGNK